MCQNQQASRLVHHHFAFQIILLGVNLKKINGNQEAELMGNPYVDDQGGL